MSPSAVIRMTLSHLAGCSLAGVSAFSVLLSLLLQRCLGDVAVFMRDIDVHQERMVQIGVAWPDQKTGNTFPKS